MIISRVDDDRFSGFIRVEDRAIALVIADGEANEDEGVFFYCVHGEGVGLVVDGHPLVAK